MNAKSQNNHYLPDICGGRYVSLIFLLGLMLSIMVWLATMRSWPLEWMDLVKTATFVQSIVLLSAFFLCLLRQKLNSAKPVVISLSGILIVFIITLVITLVFEFSVMPFLEKSGLSVFETLLRNCGIATIIAGIMFHYLYLRHESQNKTDAEHAARIEALQARMRPHFLFNCFNTIAALIRHSPEAAEQTVEDLADLFRASIADLKTMVTLKEEFDLITRYLRIEQMRVGERIRVKWDIDSVNINAIKLPLLSVQPLVENAIYHGVEQLPEGGLIEVIARTEKDKTVIEIVNPMPKTKRKGREGLHIAVENTRQRLLLAFERKATLKSAEYDNKYHVSITLPKQV